MKLPVFVNKKKETLVYYPVPKNANTTAKALFASTIGIDVNLLIEKIFQNINDPRKHI